MHQKEEEGGGEMEITKEVMEQYENIRVMSLCNMLDFGCVQDVADKLGFGDLASINRKEYVYILSNFSKLMSKFNISQR